MASKRAPASSRVTSPPLAWAALHDRALDGAGTICRIYGLNPLYGRLMTTLALSVEPLSLADLAERTQAAKSTVSVAIRRLAAFRVVQRRDVAGDRRDFYVLVFDAQEILTEFLQTYVRREIDVGRDTLTQLRQDLDRATGDDAPSAADRKVLIARVEALAAGTETAAKWVARLLDAARLRKGIFDFLGR